MMSMTGFGRASLQTPLGSFVVEVNSSNRKYLETHLTLPKEFSRFEPHCKKWISEKIARGQIHLRLIWMGEAEALSLPDVRILKEMKKRWIEIAHEIAVDPTAITLPFLVQHYQLLPKSELIDEEALGQIHEVVRAALDQLLQMRKKEGEALVLDIVERLKTFEKSLKMVEGRAPASMERYRDKLRKRTEQLLEKPLEERLWQEVVLFAEKVDVAEEITRLFSHLKQFRALLEKPDQSNGKKMDFLLQEMNRETNTIGAKSEDVTIATQVVEMKSLLEQIREQVQNIE